MAKKVLKLGRYTNDGLTSDINSLEFSESDLEKTRGIVAEDLKNIEVDLNRQLVRLDDYLKKTYGALFRNEDFVFWFFDKKKINQWGKELPKITDEELMSYSALYVKELELARKCLSEKNVNKKERIGEKGEVFTYRWNLETVKLLMLYEKLKGDFISEGTSFDTFRLLFSGEVVKDTNDKIEWIKYSKNKHVNKKSITDLIDVLLTEKIISNPEGLRRVDTVKILNTLFCSEKGNLSFTNSNFSSDRNTSEHRVDIEKIVKSIL